MKPRMILLTAAAAAALAGAATQIAGTVPTDGPSSGSLNALRTVQSKSKAPSRQHAAGAQISARAKRLLHNPGLPPWIP
jgi:hypothetical protein